jgi:hypothetical protein
MGSWMYFVVLGILLVALLVFLVLRMMRRPED